MKDDKAFADWLAKELPSVAVPAGLQARLMADFDCVAAKRRPQPLARFVETLAGRLWPGAPLWQPAGLLAASLMVGLMAGAYLPSASTAASSSTVATVDQTVIAADTPLAMDLYKDL